MHHRNKVSRAVMRGTLALLLIGTAFGVASPAQAAGSPVPVTSIASNGANNFATASATCSWPKQLHGGGARIIGGNGDVSITMLYPNLVTNTMTAVGQENGTGGGQWQVQVVAICANATPDLEVVVDSIENFDTTKSVTPVCPSGKKLYGMGWQIVGGPNGEVFIQEVEPAAGLNSVTASASTNGGWAGLWNLLAWGICGPETSGMSRIELWIPGDATPVKSAEANCPAGTYVYSIGGEVSAGGDVVLDRFFPNVPLTRARVDAQANGAFSGDWALNLYAVCV